MAIAACLSAAAQWNFDAKSAESITGSYKDLGKKATVIATNFNGAAMDADNDNSAVQNIGFDFKFNGQSFNTFVLNTNGFIKLGSVAPSSTYIYYTTAVGGGNCTITAKDSNLIYAFNRNMIAEKGTEYKVLTTGSNGSRVCTIQFKNLADKISPAQYSAISFQIKLYETTNVIEFVYDEWTAAENAATLTVAAVGIKGNNVESSVNVAKGSAIKWDEKMGQNDKPYVFINGNYSVKGPNFGNKNAALPEAGHIYRFTPLK